MSHNMSPDARKKKHALPSLLSNLRNAQAVIGRATEDLHDRETRPLVGGGGGGGGGRMAPQLHRGVPSASLSSTLNNFSQRFGSKWRKRTRRKQGHGVTSVPQTFFIAVGCFFFAIPIFFVCYILARHAVFGDESDSSVTKVHIHEVPSSFANGAAFGSGKEILERDTIEHPEKGVEDGGENIDDQLEMYKEVAVDTDMVEEKEDLPIVLDETATNELSSDEKQGELDETSTSDTLIETPSQIESMKDPIMEANEKDSAISAYNITGGVDGSMLAQNEIKSIDELKKTEEDNPERSKKSSSEDSSSASIREAVVISFSSSDQTKEGSDEGKEKEVHHNNLRGSQDGR